MDFQAREKEFANKVNRLIEFPYEMRKEFIAYWTEPDRAPKPKMRWEKEKTWDLSRRLHRWQNSGFNKGNYGSKNTALNGTKIVSMTTEIKEIIELDRLLSLYKQHPTEVPFDRFGQFYDYLKGEKLIKPLTGSEIQALRDVYNNDNYKCRCACVQMTFDGYVNSGITFSDIMNMRQKLQGA